jgi:hypothetical protein
VTMDDVQYTMPVPDLIQVLYDLIVYMTGDPEFTKYDFTAAKVVAEWCQQMGAVE